MQTCWKVSLQTAQGSAGCYIHPSPHMLQVTTSPHHTRCRGSAGCYRHPSPHTLQVTTSLHHMSATSPHHTQLRGFNRLLHPSPHTLQITTSPCHMFATSPHHTLKAQQVTTSLTTHVVCVCVCVCLELSRLLQPPPWPDRSVGPLARAHF